MQLTRDLFAIAKFIVTGFVAATVSTFVFVMLLC